MENKKKLKEEREKYLKFKGRIESVGNKETREKMGEVGYNSNFSDVYVGNQPKEKKEKTTKNKNANKSLDEFSDSEEEEEEKPKKKDKKKANNKNKKDKNLWLSFEFEGSSSEEDKNNKEQNKENINTANYDKNLIDISEKKKDKTDELAKDKYNKKIYIKIYF